MNLTRFDPFRELEDLSSRLSRLLSVAPGRADDNGLTFAYWAPPMDVQETAGEYLLKADLPEVKKEDVKVSMLDGVLCVEGERRQEKEEKDKKFHRVERAYGRFVRRMALPTNVDAGRIAAEFKDGVLNIHLPKAPEVKPKAIEVQVA
jgi:HSP20 family protein